MTTKVDGSLLSHGVHGIDGLANGRFTACADTIEEMDDLLATVRKSPLTELMWKTDDHDGDVKVPGSAARDITVRYDFGNSTNDALVFRGFIPDESVRMQGGRERRTMLVHEMHQMIRERRGDSGGVKR